MADVAKAAKVGSATVDRVLNERGNVSEEVRKKVLKAARDLGLRRILPQSYMRMIRVNLIVTRPDLPLMQKMVTEFRNATRLLREFLTLHITTLDEETPQAITKTLRSNLCDCVVIYAPDAPQIRDAVDDLSQAGVPVITIISDLPNSRRLAYAGTNHFAAGRTAGYFLSRMLPDGGEMVVLCNQMTFQSHSDRVSGLQSYLAEAQPNLRIVEVIEALDDRQRARARLEAAFRAFPGILAVYNVGAANLGVRAAIETGLLPHPPLFIGHELTVHTARMLRDGVMTLTIDQSPKLQAQFAVDVILDHFGHEGIPIDRPYLSSVPIVLFGPEYIPPGID